MKRVLTAALALLLPLSILAACGENNFSSSEGAPGQGDLSSIAAETPDPAGEASAAGESQEDESLWEEMLLMEVDETGVTAVAGEAGTLLTFGLPENITLEPGLGDQLKPGMTVSVQYDGYVMETYPGQINADAIQATAYDDGLVSLYFDILEELYGEDEGLNEDCKYFGFDLSGAKRLTQKEVEAIGWVFASSHQCEPLYGSIQELGDQGYIDMENLSWKDGIHFEFKASEISETGFTLDVTKWRSGLGAYGFQLKAEKENGLWAVAETGMGWVS